jgi:hypothetical protein
MQFLSKQERHCIIATAAASTPCRNCSVIGHFKPDCPTPEAKIQTRYPPSAGMDVLSIRMSDNPYETYCQLLVEHVVVRSETTLSSREDTNLAIKEPLTTKSRPCSPQIQVLDTGLTASSSEHKQEGNWNSSHKSIYTIATRQDIS